MAKKATATDPIVTGRKTGTYLLLIIGTTLWGSAFVMSKISVGAVPPSVAAFLRFGL